MSNVIPIGNHVARDRNMQNRKILEGLQMRREERAPVQLCERVQRVREALDKIDSLMRTYKERSK